MTQVLVDRELLERAVKADASRGASSIALVDGWKAMEQIRAILASPAQQVEAVEVVGYRFFHVDHGYIFRRTHIYEGNPSLEAHSLMTVAQHKRILAASVPAGCKVVLPEPDFALDGGSTPCYYAETIRALLTSAEGGER